MNRILRIVLSAICAATLLACAPACTSTITPDTVDASSASYDDGVLNSGVICRLSDADGNCAGWVITERARARYNALVAKYGATTWNPPIGADYGITPYSDGNCQMTDEAMAKFISMAQMARMSSVN